MSYTEETIDALLGIREAGTLLAQASQMLERAESRLTHGGRHALPPEIDEERDQLRWAIIQTMLQIDKYRDQARRQEARTREAYE